MRRISSRSRTLVTLHEIAGNSQGSTMRRSWSAAVRGMNAVASPSKSQCRRSTAVLTSLPVRFRQQSHSLCRRHMCTGKSTPKPKQTDAAGEVWYVFRDPATNQQYYYHPSAGQSQWKTPPAGTVIEEPPAHVVEAVRRAKQTPEWVRLLGTGWEEATGPPVNHSTW